MKRLFGACVALYLLAHPLAHAQQIDVPGFLIGSRANVEVVETIFKFGQNTVVAGTEETIWSHGGLFNYPAAPAVVNVTSASDDDAIGGTGARQVEIVGLCGEAWEACEEIVSLNGQTIVTTVNWFVRVNRIKVTTAGDDGENAGKIYVFSGAETDGVPDDADQIWSVVEAGLNQTLQASWTVPGGATGYLLFFGVNSFGQGNLNQVATVRLMARTDGGPWQVKNSMLLYNARRDLEFRVPRIFPEKTDLEIRGQTASGDADVSGVMHFVWQ